MFQHMLLPTDGSPLAYKAIQAGVDLARKLNARVTGYFALPKRYPSDDPLANEVDAQYAARMRHEAELALAVILREARYACDSIFMASHGRSALPASILGSVAQKVIQMARVPVVVFRAP